MLCIQKCCHRSNDGSMYSVFYSIDYIVLYFLSLFLAVCAEPQIYRTPWPSHHHNLSFLSRVSILLLTRDIDIVILSVRPSVRDTLVLYENGLTYRHIVFPPYGSPIIPVLRASNIFTKFRRGHPLRGRDIQVGYKIEWFSTNKSLYLANDTAMVTMEGE